MCTHAHACSRACARAYHPTDAQPSPSVVGDEIAHVPQPSGVRGLAAANALPGPPITSLMHASACHRTRMHAPARTAEPVCSQSWAMKSRSLPRALKFPGKTAKVTISTKMFAKTLQEQKLGYKIPVPRYNTRSLPRLCNSPSKIVQDSPIVHDINLLAVLIVLSLRLSSWHFLDLVLYVHCVVDLVHAKVDSFT